MPIVTKLHNGAYQVSDIISGYQHESQRSDAHVILSMNNSELNTFDIKMFFTDSSVQRIWETVEGINAARKLYLTLTMHAPSRRYKKSYETETMPKTVYA